MRFKHFGKIAAFFYIAAILGVTASVFFTGGAVSQACSLGWKGWEEGILVNSWGPSLLIAGLGEMWLTE